MVEQRFGEITLISALITLAVVILITTAGVFFVKNYQGNPRSVFQIKKQTFLASVFNNPEEYKDVFSKLKNPAQEANADAGIISHHFLAKQLIADFYNRIGSDKILTVFLVSPDHYNNYFKPETIAYTSYLDWTTPFGQLQTDCNSVKSLLDNGGVETKDSVLGLEHGIYVEIPFVKKFFPNAKIVPLVLRNNLPYADFLDLGREIKKISHNSSILIVSSDFSHDSSVEEAKANDKKSTDALDNLNADDINQVTNDCKQCLATLRGFLTGNQDNFTIVDNKNSFDVSGEDENSVTSYVSGYYAKKDYAQILFVGDLMFDRGIRYYAKNNGGNEFIFDKISPLLSDNDLVVANLEGPITDNKSISSGTIPGSIDNYFFTFDPSLAGTLFMENIRLVDLGNNHILNFGQEGLNSTEKYLSGANVDYFGEPGGEKSAVEDIGGIKIAFVSYNEFSGNDIGDEQKATINEIKKIKSESDIVVVFSHWGVEYSLTPTDGQEELARQFIDAGSDLVVGAHPHVIEGPGGVPEVYNGKRIYYSLGNFIFDQYFNENVRNGLGLTVKIDKTTKQLDFSEENFYLQSGGQTIEKSGKK